MSPNWAKLKVITAGVEAGRKRHENCHQSALLFHLLSFRRRFLMLEMENFPKQLLIHYREDWQALVHLKHRSPDLKTSGNNAVKGPRASQLRQ